jgi:hypothetical protein
VGDPRGDVCWGLIDMLLSRCGIRRGGHVWGKYNFHFDDQDLWIEFECHINHPGESWLRLRYQICDYWTGEPHDIDELILSRGHASPVRRTAVVVRVPERIVGGCCTFRSALAVLLPVARTPLPLGTQAHCKRT